MSYKTPRYNIFTAKLKKTVISGHGNETKNLSPVRSQTLTSTQLKKTSGLQLCGQHLQKTLEEYKQAARRLGPTPFQTT